MSHRYKRNLKQKIQEERAQKDEATMLLAGKRDCNCGARVEKHTFINRMIYDAVILTDTDRCNVPVVDCPRITIQVPDGKGGTTEARGGQIFLDRCAMCPDFHADTAHFVECLCLKLNDSQKRAGDAIYDSAVIKESAQAAMMQDAGLKRIARDQIGIAPEAEKNDEKPVETPAPVPVAGRVHGDGGPCHCWEERGIIVPCTFKGPCLECPITKEPPKPAQPQAG